MKYWGLLCVLLCLSPVSAGMLFDGTDDFITLANPTQVAFAAPGSVEVWLKSSNDASQIVFSVSDKDAPVSYWALFVGNGVTGALTDELITLIRVDAGSTTYVLGYTTATRTELFDGAWHHVVITANGTAVAIYLDGASKTITVGTGSNNGTFTNVTGADSASIVSRIINGAARDVYFTGTLGLVRVYMSALSATTVAGLFGERLLRSSLAAASSLRASYPLDECADNASGDAVTFVDRAGNGINGTGDNGANNTGLTCKAADFLLYPGGVR